MIGDVRHAHLLVVEGRGEGHKLSLRSSNSGGERKGHAGAAVEEAGFKPGEHVVVVSVEDARRLGLLSSPG